MSTFRSSLCRTFGSKLPDYSLSFTSACQTPGPGQYPAPSEFGIYRAQEKYVKETERVSERRKTAMTSRSNRLSTGNLTERSITIRLSSPLSKGKTPLSSPPDKMVKVASEAVLKKENSPSKPLSPPK